VTVNVTGWARDLLQTGKTTINGSPERLGRKKNLVKQIVSLFGRTTG
jgi:hypothetical protein